MCKTALTSLTLYPGLFKTIGLFFYSTMTFCLYLFRTNHKKTMKKVTVFAVSILFAGIASAQDLTSKKGETILPEEGDYALGFDAAPFLNYVGNFLNQAGNNAPGADYVNGFNQTIVGKMFKDAQTAYRAKVRLGFGSTTRKNLVNDDANTTDPNARVEDEQKSSYTSVTLGAGLEKRRGNTRVQGLFGGEVLVGFTNRNTTSTFGNSFSTTNTMHQYY